jgi:repressor LexA
MLTTKQKELLTFINARLQETGVPPSFDEMKEALALQSKSGVHRLIIALEERGFIRRLPHRARAIEVIKLPMPCRSRQRPAPNRLQSQRHRRLRAPATTAAELGAIGLRQSRRLQRAPDGPHCRRRADQRHPEPHAGHRRTAEMIAGGEHFALEVKGDSMIDAGINEGDIIICKRCDTGRERRHRRGARREGGGHPQAPAQEGRLRSRWKPPTPTTRRASSAPTRSTSRAA